MADPYDIVIIGAGPGGYVAAIRAAQLGARVALVEKDRLGGTCLNRGCIPSKAMVTDAELYANAVSGQYGLDAEGSFRVNFSRLMDRQRQVVKTVVDGVAYLMQAHRIDVVSGSARIVEPGKVEVTREGATQPLTAKTIIIATGSVADDNPMSGSDLPGVITSDGIWGLETQPKSMVVVGASIVGMEFACIFQALGTQVSVLGRRTFLRDAEQQLARRMRTLLAQRMSITIGLEFQGITRTEEGLLRVSYEQKGKPGQAEGELVLLATGRWPYTAGLGLEELGIAMNGRAIAVNEYLETNVPGIYAIGDCIGGCMLAHVASYEGEVAVENILTEEKRAVDYRVVPNCIFTIPEVAGVGLTEEQAKAEGLSVLVSRFPFNANGRAVALGDPDGQIRMICEKGPDGHGGKVIGVHIMGPHASDVIAEAALAIRMGLSAKDIAHTIHQHPTVPEALMEAAKGQIGGAIHFIHH